MIVREIVKFPELIKKFDWFNDYKDTRSYLLSTNVGGSNDDLLFKLDDGWREFLKNQRDRQQDLFG